MKIAFLIALLSFASQAVAADPTHAICRIKEKRGRQTEDYDLRMSLPSFSTQFNLRLFPKVLVDAWVLVEGEKNLPMFTFSILDYDLEGETIGDIQVASGRGYEFFRMYTKLGKHTYEFEVNCQLEK